MQKNILHIKYYGEVVIIVLFNTTILFNNFIQLHLPSWIKLFTEQIAVHSGMKNSHLDFGSTPVMTIYWSAIVRKSHKVFLFGFPVPVQIIANPGVKSSDDHCFKLFIYL